jgi:CelD/BcsL family acetyltransferase involved in cellulose biosynthesis
VHPPCNQRGIEVSVVSGSAMTKTLKATVSSSFFDVDKHADEWDRLAASSISSTVFLTSGWLRAWSETLGRHERIIVAQVRQNKDLIGAAAFQENNGIVQFAGKGPSDYSDFIVASRLDEIAAAEVIEKLLVATSKTATNFRYFNLGRIPTDSKTLDCLKRLDTRFYSTYGRRVPAPSMEMYAAEEKLRKKSLRRHERGLQRKGKLVSKTYMRANDIMPLLNVFFDQHIERWSKTQTPSLFLKRANREFYQKLTRYLDATGFLRFTVLSLDKRIIATHFGFMQGGRFIWYKPTFDPQLSKLSPGEVLLKRLIEQAQAEGALEFDFTIGGEAFKYRFATKVREVIYVHITDSWLRSRVKRTRVFLSKRIRKNREY